MAKFTDLPYEIRREIYLYVFDLFIEWYGFLPTYPSSWVLRSSLPMCLAMSPGMHAEALEVLHQSQHFESHIPWFGSGRVVSLKSDKTNGFVAKLYKPTICIRSKFPSRVRNLALSFRAGYNYDGEGKPEFYIHSAMPSSFGVSPLPLRKHTPTCLVSVETIRLDMVIIGLPYLAYYWDLGPSGLQIDDISARLQELLDQIKPMFPLLRAIEVHAKRYEYSSMDILDPDFIPKFDTPMPLNDDAQKTHVAERIKEWMQASYRSEVSYANPSSATDEPGRQEPLGEPHECVELGRRKPNDGDLEKQDEKPTDGRSRSRARKLCEKMAKGLRNKIGARS